MTGLFLRYCWRCNATSTVAVTAKGTCTECGEQVGVVDAHALIPALGAKLDQGQREAATASVKAHDRPEGT